MTDTEWLADLKPGDEVAVRSGYGYPVYTIEEVDRVTPAQIVVGHWRYRKSDGMAVGHTGYSCNHLEFPDQKIRDIVERKELVRRLAATDWNAMSIEKLREIVALKEQA
jgi:hypothetical protein